MKASFSVLMSVYVNDSLKQLQDAVNSILLQTLRSEQFVIVVDGPVSEDVENYLREIEKRQELIEVHWLKNNGGLARALNYGLGFCRNNIVARMDADDYSFDTRFENTISHFDDEIGFLGADYDIYDEEMKQKIGERCLPLEHETLLKFSRTRTPFNHPTALLNRIAVLSVGGYPEKIGRFEDWGLALRLMKAGYQAKNLRIKVLKFRGGVNMLERRSGLKYAVEEVSALVKLFREGLLSYIDLFKNLVIRIPLRILPKFIVRRIYTIIQS